MIRKLWADEKPKQSGYYWFKSADGKWIDVVHVRRGKVIVYPTETTGGTTVRLKDFAEGKWHGPVPFPSLHRANKHEARLKELTQTVVDCLLFLDAVMDRPDSPERGQLIARMANALGFANDAATHITLGMSFEQMDALKRKRARLLKRGKLQQAGEGVVSAR